ncbi:hypothetical protein [Paenibacillus paeoniae]|uniref:DUF4190 domain-containing protein n=1 Tax=Paenibacillus paeoniae TaxID=2292705 RepID=A0A371PNP3_9BACL|nr:hypothetical protein [Paenibacillus paeoniae]REK77387.1 hypothetical protein DX130_10415 [Paenibacillus paeoniae]
MDRNRDNEVEYRRSSEPETEANFAPTNSGYPTQMVNVNEEMGADFAYGMPVTHTERIASRPEQAGQEVVTESKGYALGWVSLVFAIASWFIWPVLMGATSAILGFIAYRQGARALGVWSMSLGLIAVVLNLVIVPFYYALT